MAWYCGTCHQPICGYDFTVERAMVDGEMNDLVKEYNTDPCGHDGRPYAVATALTADQRVAAIAALEES